MKLEVSGGRKRRLFTQDKMLYAEDPRRPSTVVLSNTDKPRVCVHSGSWESEAGDSREV